MGGGSTFLGVPFSQRILHGGLSILGVLYFRKPQRQRNEIQPCNPPPPPRPAISRDMKFQIVLSTVSQVVGPSSPAIQKYGNPEPPIPRNLLSLLKTLKTFTTPGNSSPAL